MSNNAQLQNAVSRARNLPWYLVIPVILLPCCTLTLICNIITAAATSGNDDATWGNIAAVLVFATFSGIGSILLGLFVSYLIEFGGCYIQATPVVLVTLVNIACLAIEVMSHGSGQGILIVANIIFWPITMILGFYALKKGKRKVAGVEA